MRDLSMLARIAAGVCLFGLAGCQGDYGAIDDTYAIGTYELKAVNGEALPNGSDVRLGPVESGSITLNADHTFSEREVIRVIGRSTTSWSSSGTWTLDGDKLVKVHNTPAGPVTELAMLFRDTIEAGSTVLVRK